MKFLVGAVFSIPSHKIKEADFIGQYGYTVDESASEKFKNRVVY